MSDETTSELLESVIDGWQEGVLDLTRRNKLIDFTDTKTKSVVLEGADPTSTAERLLTGKISLRKRPLEPSDGAVTRRSLFPDYEPEVAADSLVNLDRLQQEYLRERGVDTLFLSLCRLRWFADPENEEALQSPLLLVPVQLSQEPVTAPEYHEYKISYEGGALQLNPALRKKLEIERSITLPPDNEVEASDLEVVFEEVEEIANSFQTWEVTREQAICIFDFANISLYEDIERNRDAMMSDPLVRAIAGDPSELTATQKRAEPNSGDLGNRKPEESAEVPTAGRAGTPTEGTTDQNEGEESETNMQRFQVLEADPTQREAIDAALQGEDFVLQGPPGTGKSQTIANIIAEKIAQGEQVLFVSEKQAALDIVQTRLDEVGVGRFCLEVHGTNATKSSVMDSIESELHGDRIQPPEGWEESRGRRDDIHKKLGDYGELLTSSPDSFSKTPYQALGIVARLDDLPRIATQIDRPLSVDQKMVDSAIEYLRELETFTDSISNWKTHPWRNTTIDSWRVDTRKRMAESLDSQLHAIQELVALSGTIEETYGITLERLDDISASCESLDTLAFAPREHWSAELLDPAFFGHESTIGRLAEAHIEFSELEAYLDNRYESSIYSEDGGNLHHNVARFGLSRFVRPSYYSLKRRLASHSRDRYDPSYSDLLEDMRKLARLQDLQDEIDNTVVEERFLEPFETGSGIDWHLLRGVQESISNLASLEVVSFEKVDGEITEPQLDRAHNLSQDLRDATEKYRDAFGFFDESMAVDSIRVGGQPLEFAGFNELQQYLEHLRTNIDRLQDWVQFQKRKQNTVDTLAESYLENFLTQGHKPEWLADGFRREFYRSWLNVIYDRTELSSFNTGEFEHFLEEYRRLDRKLLGHARVGVQHAVTDQRPDMVLEHAESSSQVILKREIQKQHHRRSLRDLFADAGSAIQDLKPCFMMSPRMVAQSLQFGEISFDTVIFDEASQIPPEQAVSTLIRGNQAIIAGDSNQLPPTQFFSTDVAGATNGRADLESILDEATAVLPERRLTWHYRSKSTELIAFSNRRYYDGRLKTFPEPSPRDGSCFDFEYISEGVYDRGGSRTNQVEAERVVDIVEDHAENRPGQTLGVVAFSRAQEGAIRKILEDRRQKNSDLDRFLSQDSIQEEFFVKSLEIVQGDERDRIIFSVGYGPDDDGKITMNFGPLNESGGERRLNVAITRARERVSVVTSLLPEDIESTQALARGVREFKEYLAHVRECATENAQGKPSRSNETLDPAFDTELEADVYEMLTVEGLTVDPSPGGSGYTLDMAVRDPNDQEAYVLGIEVDGSAHRNSVNLQERDRLRQQVLNQRGWILHRVWAPEWASSPQRKRDEIIARIKELSNGEADVNVPKLPPIDPPGPEAVDASEQLREFANYKPPVTRYDGTEVDGPSREDVQKALMDIVGGSAPIAETVAYRSLAKAFGKDRLGSDLRNALQAEARFLATHGAVHIRDGFLWPPKDHFNLHVRKHDDHDRTITEVAIPELAKATYVILENGGEMTRSDLVLETTRKLGYDRTGSRIRTRINQAIDLLTRVDAAWESGNNVRSDSSVEINRSLRRIVYNERISDK